MLHIISLGEHRYKRYKHIYAKYFQIHQIYAHNTMTLGQVMKLEPPRVPNIASLEILATKNIILNIIRDTHKGIWQRKFLH